MAFRFLNQELVYPGRRGPAYQHVVDRICRDLQDIFGGIDMVIYKRRDILDPVFYHRI